MREIKFRAWDKVNKEMLIGEGHGQPLAELTINALRYPEDYIFMQYTGLKAKNGKEIYEGDIVHFRTIGGNRMTYLVYWSDAKTGFKPTRLTQNNQTEIEVVGNIYENEGLLEKMN